MSDPLNHFFVITADEGKVAAKLLHVLSDNMFSRSQVAQ